MDDPKAVEERLITECARMLTVSLSDPAEFPFAEFLERIEAQSADDEPVGRRWIAAVHRVHAAGRLTDDQAHALIHQIAYAVISECFTRDPVMGPLTRQIQEIAEALKRSGEPEDGAAAKAANKQVNKLLMERMVRHEVICIERLRALGEEELAQRMQTEGRAFRVSAMEGLKQLWAKEGDDGRSWKIAYPSPDSPIEKQDSSSEGTANGGEDEPEEDGERDGEEDSEGSEGSEDESDADEEDEDPDAILADYVSRWREATSGGGIWTVDAVLAFAYVGSYDNEDGYGDLWIASIQTARELGALDKSLSYLLLDRVADAMVADSPASDKVLCELEEQLDEIPYDESLEGKEPFDGDPRDREAWRALHAAYLRRREVLKRALLAAAGEAEMVRLMEERPAEFRVRVRTAATEWDVKE
jgi:hypothetical protein